MWYLLQITVFLAVMFASIYYQWSDIVGPDSLAPAAIAMSAAWLATVLVNGLLSLFSR